MSTHDIGNIIETDLLIIGGGFGGLFAAIKAKQNGAHDVLIVDKGAVGLTGKSKLAAGATIFLHPGDDLQQWTKAIFLGQQGLCNQDMVESFLEQSTDRLRELESLGIAYRSVTNQYTRVPSRGLGPVQMTLFPEYEGLVGGSALTAVLCKEALRLGIRFLNKIFISDLIVRDNRALGAVGCHRRTGEFHVFKSRAVVIAAADCSFRGNYACVEQTTGDAFAMAHRAGADLTNMEFLVSNTGALKFNFEGTGPAGQFGAKFLNARDEDFMPNYRSEGSGAEINHIVQAMVAEKKQGKGPPFYFDFRALPDWLESLYMGMGGWMPRNLTRLKEKSIDPFKSKVEWVPVLQTLRGGIKTGIHCMSNINGLFAAGIAQSMGPGLFNGWSSGRCFWSGSTAGTFAAKYIKDMDSRELNSDQIADLKNRLYNRKISPENGGVAISEITRNLQECMFSYETSILKSENSLKSAIRQASSINDDKVSEAKIPDLHEFIKFKETENMLLTAELYLTASLLRRESRADHQREDFPETDKKWLKWIVFNEDLEGGYRFDDLPWEKYRFQPGDLAENARTLE